MVIMCVSCSGKCGSQTLAASFQYMGISVERCHALSPESIRNIGCLAPTEPVLFIDSTRDLIARRISSFFQNLSSHIGMNHMEIMLAYNNDKFKFVDYLICEFNKIILSLEQYYASESWSLFGVNYLEDGFFDFENKFQLINSGNYYFVNVRFDDIINWECIIRSLPIPLELSNFKIIIRNIVVNKGDMCKDIYFEFLRRVKIKKSDFDEIVNRNIDHINHFYTKEEVEIFMEKWKPYLLLH